MEFAHNKFIIIISKKNQLNCSNNLTSFELLKWNITEFVLFFSIDIALGTLPFGNAGNLCDMRIGRKQKTHRSLLLVFGLYFNS